MKNAPARERQNLDVTVVVTSYDHQAFVEQCLDSIAAQTQQPRQVIIIDDHSRDATADVIDRWLDAHNRPYQFINHGQNRGICASLNEALALAEGSFFCQVSADDWEQSDRFERQVAALESSSADTALFVGDIREVDGGGGTIVDHDFGKRIGNVTGTKKQSALIGRLLAENVIPAPGVLMRTDHVREIGGYDEKLAFEDYDMWLRLASHFSIGYSPGIVANYRVLASSMFRNPKRRASILTSEADILAKHVGTSPENDAIIAGRLALIAGDLLDLDAAASFRRVITEAATASSEPWLAEALWSSRRLGGLTRVRKKYGDRLGVSKTAPKTAA